MVWTKTSATHRLWFAMGMYCVYTLKENKNKCKIHKTMHISLELAGISKRDTGGGCVLSFPGFWGNDLWCKHGTVNTIQRHEHTGLLAMQICWLLHCVVNASRHFRGRTIVYSVLQHYHHIEAWTKWRSFCNDIWHCDVIKWKHFPRYWGLFH